MNIFLIGMMGSGKSSLASKLASKLNFKLIDTDLEIENHYGRSIAEIFKNEGEMRFRKMEQETISNLIESSNQVVATGGGLPCFNKQMEVIKKAGLTIYLKANEKFLASRLLGSKETRPLIAAFDKQELQSYLRELLLMRNQYYNQAEVTIDAKDIKIEDLIEIIGKYN
jgi:shikimate kinase